LARRLIELSVGLGSKEPTRINPHQDFSRCFMATFTQDFLNTNIDLSHEETLQLIELLKKGADSAAALSAFGIPAFAVGIIAAALAIHATWEIAWITSSDRGSGVRLTCPLYLAPSMIVIPSPRIPEASEGWSRSMDYQLLSTDGDVIKTHIVVNGDPSTIVFRLKNQCGWDKAFQMFDGEGNNWVRVARGHSQVEDSLWSGQVKNNQPFIFRKPKMFGVWHEILAVHELEFLKPGSVVTFSWIKD
jgi:hypothetical protein